MFRAAGRWFLPGLGVVGDSWIGATEPRDVKNVVKDRHEEGPCVPKAGILSTIPLDDEVETIEDVSEESDDCLLCLTLVVGEVGDVSSVPALDDDLSVLEAEPTDDADSVLASGNKLAAKPKAEGNKLNLLFWVGEINVLSVSGFPLCVCSFGAAGGRYVEAGVETPISKGQTSSTSTTDVGLVCDSGCFAMKFLAILKSVAPTSTVLSTELLLISPMLPKRSE